MANQIARLATAAACAAALLFGCSDETVYHPQAIPPPPKPAPAVQKPPAKPKSSAAIVEKVGDVDFAKYGIPIYPGARIDTDASLAYTAAKKGSKQISVSLDSSDAVPEIATWYRDNITAKAGQASPEIAGVDGTTSTGYHVSISIANVDTVSKILITVDEKPQK